MPPNQHALLSASSAHRWTHCTPSARLEQEFADRETEAAAEGTAAHALCEHKLRRVLKMRSKKPVSQYDSDEMDGFTDDYVQFVKPAEAHGIRFSYQSGMMFVRLPSGRNLVYVKPRIGENQFGGESITYYGVGEQKKWTRLETYGPKLVENIVQATARDILAEAMLRLNRHGYNIVMHIHDEAVIEAPESTSLEHICSVMAECPAWAQGLLLRADGYVCDFYKKD